MIQYIYIYSVCRRGDANVCQTRQPSYNIYTYHNKYIFGILYNPGNNYLF